MDREKKVKTAGSCNSKERIKPSDIKGKIEVADRRERKDGPGGD